MVGILLSAHQLTSHAAGFALSEQSGSGMGNAYAGAAAVAEDASTIYFNPAGMTYIQGRQLVGAMHTIKTSGDFNNQSNQLGSEGGDFGSWAFLPNIYYKQDLTEQLKFGIGVGTPFGLKTEYNRNWLGRFQAVKSELKTININPSLAWKVNDQWSLGLGVSAMWAQAELTSRVNFGAGPDVKNKGNDWGFGYNLGAIYQATPDTRFGVAYRSKVEQHLKGNVRSSLTALNPNPAATLNTDISADITLPETFSLSAFSHLNDQWELLTDITWTRWSQFKDLKIIRENGSNTTVGPAITEHWNNVLRYSLGMNYLYSDTIKLRTGVAYDDEAIDNEHRTARIPGNDRIWLSLGASWQYTPETKLDIGYTHLFIKDARINDDQRLTGRGLLAGKYEGSADILSMQFTHNF
jgi:long-chain fatty acid transport protein